VSSLTYVILVPPWLASKEVSFLGFHVLWVRPQVGPTLPRTLRKAGASCTGLPFFIYLGFHVLYHTPMLPAMYYTKICYCRHIKYLDKGKVEKALSER
jgi:hypothetical protein